MNTSMPRTIVWTVELILGVLVIALVFVALPPDASANKSSSLSILRQNNAVTADSSRVTLFNSSPLTWYGEVLIDSTQVQAQSFKTNATETKLTGIDLNLYNYDRTVGAFSVDLYRANAAGNQPDDAIKPLHIGGGDLAKISASNENLNSFRDLALDLLPNTNYFVVVSSQTINSNRALTWGFGNCIDDCGGQYDSYWSQKIGDNWSDGIGFNPCRMTIYATTPSFDLGAWLAGLFK